MINEKELLIASDSYIKKDFYQIYPEILDLVKKISNRWNPETSNESDPGVVLLKLLAFIADKNNYNIDKNILECFMPSASQEESMRKLCDMMGYEMKYYQSATTKISFMYQGSELTDGKAFTLKAFDTVISNEDDDIEYVLTKDVTLSEKYRTYEAPAIEGTLCNCTAGDSDLIKLYNLDDNNRFYLPETMIAENGIFITNVEDNKENIWKKVNNLNTQQYNSDQYVYKFGFDSKKQLPYVEFPDNVADIINDGINIRYMRTSGINGNTNAKTLVKRVDATKVYFDGTSTEVSLEPINDQEILIISNQSSATNGRDKESINEAYNSFKKTVGTFDTLVTCRDYANKIYNLVSSEDNSSPLVSNVQVSDIRDNIWKANTVTTFNDYGLVYKSVPEYYLSNPLIKGSDLYFYPFTPIVTSYTKDSYINSFKPYFLSMTEIETDLKEYQSMYHDIKTTENTSDFYCLKNYYDLDAKITTTRKVNESEESSILSNVYKALYKKFNMRNIDFGEEILYDSILDTIQTSDTRIKNVSLEEPVLTTYIMDKIGNEFNLTSPDINHDRSEYIKLVSKNVLANRVPLFNYNKDFEFSFDQKLDSSYSQVIYGGEGDPVGKIAYINTYLTIPSSAYTDYEVKKNETIQFMAPSFSSKMIYPAYVNYNFKANTPTRKIAKDEEYKLAQGDILYINYTDSNGNVFNVKYTYNQVNKNGIIENKPEGNIIKPNFELEDSNRVNSRDIYGSSARSWSKESGWDFGSDTLAGMFSLKPNEQIDIRDQVKVELNSPKKCYWLIKDGTIPFDANHEYLLEDGEYFFYTNDAMTELVSFGSGTLLKNTDVDPNQFVINYNEAGNKVNPDDISSNGLAAFADTAWKVINFTSSQYLTIQEMQIINLIEEDILNSITPLSGQTISSLTCDWKAISSASYTLLGEAEKDLDVLPVNINWKVRTRLDLNVGKNLIQTLGDYQEIYFNDENDDVVVEVYPHGSNPKIYPSIKSNYLLQRAGGQNISVKVSRYDEDDNRTDIDDFQVCVFEKKPAIVTDPSNIQSEFVEFNDLNDIYTKLNLSSVKSLDLNIIIPSNHFGLLMLFYTPTSDTSVVTKASIKTSDTSAAGKLSWFNDTTSPATELSLKVGLNIIKVPTSCTLSILRNNDDKGTIIFSQFDVIDDTNSGVNIELLGLKNQLISGVTEANYLLGILKDSDFYYNCPRNNDIAIDTEDLSDPKTWYDYNNIGNKFIISELNAETFKTGIKLTKSSRL